MWRIESGGTGRNTRVFYGDIELKGITAVNIEKITGRSIVQASITVYLSGLDVGSIKTVTYDEFPLDTHIAKIKKDLRDAKIQYAGSRKLMITGRMR